MKLFASGKVLWVLVLRPTNSRSNRVCLPKVVWNITQSLGSGTLTPFVVYPVCLAASLSGLSATLCTAVVSVYLCIYVFLYRKCIYRWLLLSVSNALLPQFVWASAFGANWPVALMVQLSFKWTHWGDKPLIECIMKHISHTRSSLNTTSMPPQFFWAS